MIIIFLNILFSINIFSLTIDFSLEQNIRRMKANPKYVLVESIDLNKTNHDYRVVLNIKNNTQFNYSAIAFRYSFKLNLKKGDNTYQTISLYSSTLRVSEIKKDITKKIFIYEIKNIFSSILKYKKFGYLPVEIVLDVMKEPKKDEELNFYTASFKIQ